MSRVYNFSAGPAVLPEEVLREAACQSWRCRTVPKYMIQL